MTVNEFYYSAKKFLSIANQLAFTNAMNSLFGLMNQIKQLDQQNNQNADHVTALRSKLEPQRTQLVSILSETERYLRQQGKWNVMLENLFGSNNQKMIAQITNDLDLINPDLFNSIQSIVVEFQTFVSLYFQLNSTADKFALDWPEPTETEQKDSIIIKFDLEALIDDLKGLESACDDWILIINCFGRLVNDNNTKAEVLSISRGSLLLSLGIGTLIIRAIAKCSNLISEAILNSLKIREKFLELKKLSISVSSEEFDLLEKREKLTVSALTTKITVNLLEEYQNDKTVNDYHEIEGFVKKAVEKIIVFQSKGGSVEPKLLDQTANDQFVSERIKKLNEEITLKRAEVSGLLNGVELKLLEDKEDDDHTRKENEKIEQSDIINLDKSKQDNDSIV